MAYTAWSVVFGEQPTAAKWNQLGANDAGFKDGTNIDNLAILDRHIAANNLLANKISNPYKFSAYRNAAFNTAVGYQKVPLDTELFDTNNNFDPVTNNRYVAPLDGFYQFNWIFTIAITAASIDTVAVLYKNGVVISWGIEIESQGGTNGSDLLQLTAADQIELWCYTGAISAAISTKMATRLSGFLVSKI
jgi:hypothetical protein